MEIVSNRVEEARELLRAEVEHSSLRAVAERVGIDHTTLRTFIAPDGVQRPKAKVLQPILAYVEKRLGSEGSKPAGEELGGGLVQVPATTLAYWRGRFDTMADWAHALDQLMQQQREQFAQFTRGVSEFRQSGVLAPVPPPTDRPRIDPEKFRGQDGGGTAGGAESA